MTEENKAKKEKSSGHGVFGFIAGVVGGIVGGLMLAPKSGKELRQDIKTLYSDVHAEILERAKDVNKLSQKNYEEIVEEVVRKYTPILKKRKEEIGAWTKELKEEWPAIADKVKDAHERGVKAAKKSAKKRGPGRPKKS